MDGLGLLAGALSLALFFAIRLAPLWPIRHQGCDAYFFLLSAEAFRRERRVPVVLPGLYLLEPDEQWYPPGFMVFCGLLPEAVLKRHYWLISHMVDAPIAIGLYAACALATGSPWIAVGAVAAYAAAPRMAGEYASLTSRPLGALLLAAFLVSTTWWRGGADWALAGAVAFGVALIFTHKLSVQLLWFLAPFLALVYRDWLWLVPLAAAYAGAALAGRGLFVKIVRAHWDIVAFWHRNWRWLGAHLIDDSPVYGHLPERAGHYRNAGPRAWLRFAVEVGHMNYFVLFLPLALWRYDGLGEAGRFCLWWAIGTYAWAAAVYYLPFLRSLGMGEQYLKMSHAPVLFVTAVVLAQATSPWPWMLAGVCAVLTARYFALSMRTLRGGGMAQVGRVSADLEAIFTRLRAAADARIMALPLYLPDLTAYRVRRPVLWGTHGYGFREVEPLFPVMRQPVEWFVERYSLTHLLLDERYASAATLGVADEHLDARSGAFALYRLGPLVEDSAGRSCGEASARHAASDPTRPAAVEDESRRLHMGR